MISAPPVAAEKQQLLFVTDSPTGHLEILNNLEFELVFLFESSLPAGLSNIQ